MKLCVDCKWSEKPAYTDVYNCNCPYITTVCPVDGKRKPAFCRVERQDWSNTHLITCGTAGKHWEARDTVSVQSKRYADSIQFFEKGVFSTDLETDEGVARG